MVSNMDIVSIKNPSGIKWLFTDPIDISGQWIVMNVIADRAILFKNGANVSLPVDGVEIVQKYSLHGIINDLIKAAIDG